MANITWGQLGWSEGNFGGLNDITVQVTSPGTLTTWGSNSWGQFGWGENIGLSTLEGNTTIDIISVANLTGQLLNTSLNSVTVTGTSNLSLTGQQLTTTLNSVTAIIAIDVSLTGQQLTSALGIVDPGPDANLIGQQLTLSFNGNVDIDIAAVALVTAGVQLTATLNSVSIDLNTPINLTGQNLTTAINSVTITTNTPVNLTGNNLTGRTGQLYVNAWVPVDTGQSINWTEVAA
jgi:hypothetical protein